MAIHFFNEDIEAPKIDKTQIKRWVKRVVSEHSKILGEINYIFTSDSSILKINQDYLQHDYYTDVITFDYSEERKIAGDIFISLETVKSNAEKFEQDFDIELHRVIIHGILHLIGFEDKTPQNQKIMRLQENNALTLLKNI